MTDNATGLLWQRCSVGQSGANCGTGSQSSQDLASAQSICAGLTTAGKTWRLPTRIELETLPDFGTTNPTINITALPDNNGSTGDEHLSSTLTATNGNVWGVWYRSRGETSSQPTGSPKRALCVSASAQSSLVKFSDKGDGTVRDKQSGLTWQKCSVGQNSLTCLGRASTPTWTAALTACSGLSLAGKTWRLPSIKELATIVDSTVATPSIESAFFPSTDSNDYWSSSTTASGNTGAWTVGFNEGNISWNGKTANNRVRCVSGP